MVYETLYLPLEFVRSTRHKKLHLLFYFLCTLSASSLSRCHRQSLASHPKQSLAVPSPTTMSTAVVPKGRSTISVDLTSSTILKPARRPHPWVLPPLLGAATTAAAGPKISVVPVLVLSVSPFRGFVGHAAVARTQERQGPSAAVRHQPSRCFLSTITIWRPHYFATFAI